MQYLSELNERRLYRRNIFLGWLFGLARIKEDDGHWLLRVGPKSIYLANPNRWRRYKRGIPYQLKRLARSYGATEYASEFEGKVVVDLGANIGEFSMFAAAHGARVIAIEPDQLNLSVLRKNVRGTNVDIVDKALWKETTRVLLYSAPMAADSGLIRPDTASDSYEVDAVRLDDLTADLNIGDIYFIKGDAEGAEPEVLMGAKATLRRTKYVSLDCGPERQGETTVDAVIGILRDAGFDARRLEHRRVVVFGINRCLA